MLLLVMPWLLLVRPAGAAEAEEEKVLPLEPSLRWLDEIPVNPGALPAYANDALPLQDRFVMAADADDAAALELLAQLGAEINTPDSYQRRAICSAARAGAAEALDWLLARGADPQSGDRNNPSPLFAAVNGGSTDLTARLLKAGALPGQLDHYGATELHRAAEDGADEIFRLLLAHGAQLEAQDQDGFRPLHYAARRGQVLTAAQLIIAGAEVNAGLGEIDTPLHVATAHRELAAMRLLLLCGARVDARNLHGLQPLHFAGKSGYQDAVDVLLEFEAPLDDVFLAVSANAPQRLRELISASPEVLEARDWSGHTPLDWARGLDHYDCAAVWLEARPGHSDQALCAMLVFKLQQDPSDREGAMAVVRTMTDLDFADSEGFAPLHEAARNDLPLMAGLLLAEGADARQRTAQGTPAEVAVRSGSPGVLAVLLRGGARVNEADAEGQSLLHLAASSDKLQYARWEGASCLALLLTAKAEVNARDARGWTPLDCAYGGMDAGGWASLSEYEKEGRREALALLLSFGARRGRDQ